MLLHGLDLLQSVVILHHCLAVVILVTGLGNTHIAFIWLKAPLVHSGQLELVALRDQFACSSVAATGAISHRCRLVRIEGIHDIMALLILTGLATPGIRDRSEVIALLFSFFWYGSLSNLPLGLTSWALPLPGEH